MKLVLLNGKCDACGNFVYNNELGLFVQLFNNPSMLHGIVNLRD